MSHPSSFSPPHSIPPDPVGLHSPPNPLHQGRAQTSTTVADPWHPNVFPQIPRPPCRRATPPLGIPRRVHRKFPFSVDQNSPGSWASMVMPSCPAGRSRANGQFPIALGRLTLPTPPNMPAPNQSIVHSSTTSSLAPQGVLSQCCEGHAHGGDNVSQMHTWRVYTNYSATCRELLRSCVKATHAAVFEGSPETTLVNGEAVGHGTRLDLDGAEHCALYVHDL